MKTLQRRMHIDKNRVFAKAKDVMMEQLNKLMVCFFLDLVFNFSPQCLENVKIYLSYLHILSGYNQNYLGADKDNFHTNCKEIGCNFCPFFFLEIHI